MKPSTCPDCGLVLPIAHRNGCAYQRLREELSRAVTPWTPEDDRMVHWLAGFGDQMTQGWILSLVRRAAAGGVPGSGSSRGL